MKWISPKDKLPKDEQLVIVKTNKSELGYAVCRFYEQEGDESAFWYNFYTTIWNDDNVEAWQAFKPLSEKEV